MEKFYNQGKDRKVQTEKQQKRSNKKEMKEMTKETKDHNFFPRHPPDKSNLLLGLLCGLI